MKFLIFISLLLALTVALKQKTLHLSQAMQHLDGMDFKGAIASKLVNDKELRDMVLKMANQSELSKTVLNKMVGLLKSDDGLLKKLSGQIWSNPPEALKNLT